MLTELSLKSYNSPQNANRMHDQQESDAGYIYFVHKTTGERQNDNPKLLEVLKVLHQQYKSIKYITYRCATKLWLLKQSFYTVNIPYHICTSILEHHGFNQADNAPAIKPFQLTAILHDIYFAAEKCGHFSQSVNFDLGRCTALMAGFLWAVFDPNRMVPISLLELKQTLLILCNTQDYNQLVNEEFALAADHNRCVSRFRFEAMLKVISKLFCYFGEGQNYGPQFINGWVEEVFEQCPGIIGLNEYQFNCLWENQNINFAYYANVLALMKRIKESQNIVHDVQCVACKVAPIQGIRFKCQHCRKISLCYECFCNGYKTSRHELSHRMYEISTNEIVSNKFCSFLSKIFTIFARRSEEAGNLTIETKIADEPETNANNATVTIECINDMKFSSIRGSRQLKDTADQIIPMPNPINSAATKDRINTIIDLLAYQTEQFQKQFMPTINDDNGKKSKLKKQATAALEEHHVFLLEVINQLKEIYAGAHTDLLPHASTPYRQSKRCNELQQRRISIGSPLARSIRGTEVNKSFLENNKSDLSIGDISTWFQGKSPPNLSHLTQDRKDTLSTVTEVNSLDTDLQNFKDLLHKVKEIMDDSFSDNVELSDAAQQLEKILDNIIGKEENKRTYL